MLTEILISSTFALSYAITLVILEIFSQSVLTAGSCSRSAREEGRQPEEKPWYFK